MTTYAATVTAIRRLLNDDPRMDKVTTAPTGTTGTTMVVSTISLFRGGQFWEFQDGDETGAEIIDIEDVDEATSTPTIRRATHQSTAATHSNNVYVALEPRFAYDKVKQAIDTTLDVDLFVGDVFEIVEHTVGSQITTNVYNAPTTSCERILNVYQRVNSTDPPTRVVFDPYQNVDTALWSNGKAYRLLGGLANGVASFYVNCAHKLTIGTLATDDTRMVQMKACAYLLEWEEPRRSAGPTNQGDRTVKVGDSARLAAYYDDQFKRMLRDKAAYLKRQTPTGPRHFIRNR